MYFEFRKMDKTRVMSMLMLLLCVLTQTRGDCVTYDMQKSRSWETLPYEGPPKWITGRGFELLARFCPSLVNNLGYDTGAYVCCSVKQLEVFETEILKLEMTVSGCDQCGLAILDHACQMVCSPNQSEFVKVKEVGSSRGMSSSIKTVKKMALAITRQYGDAMMDVCRNVKNLASGDYALKLMCGMDFDSCTGVDVLAFALSFAPIKVELIVFDNSTVDNKTRPTSNNNITLFKKTYNLTAPLTGHHIYKCNQVIDHRPRVPNYVVGKCSCYQCSQSCFPPELPETYAPTKIMLLTVWQFSLLLFFIFFSIVFTAIGIHHIIMIQTKPYKNGVNKKKNSVEQTNLAVINIEATNVVTVVDPNEVAEPNIHQVEVGNVAENYDTIYDTQVNVKESINLENAHLMKKNKMLLQRMTSFVLTKLVSFSARFPLLIIGVMLSVLSGVCIFAYMRSIQVTSDPAELWSSKTSIYNKQREFFSENFGGFLRIEMAILTLKDSHKLNRTVDNATMAFSPVAMDYLQSLERAIKNTRTNDEANLTLTDFCFKPLWPANENCVIFSPMAYFNGSTNVDFLKGSGYFQHMKACAENPVMMADYWYNGVPCLPDFLAPIDTRMVYGGWKKDLFQESDTFIITIPLINYNEKTHKKNHNAVMRFERELSLLLEEFRQNSTDNESIPFSISYSVERGVQDAIEEASWGEMDIVLYSYGIMALYIMFNLGKFTRFWTLIFVDCKIMAGLYSIVIIALSVASTVSFFSLLNVKANMVIFEVLPFLILAVGTDNIFIIVKNYYETYDKLVKIVKKANNTEPRSVLLFLAIQQKNKTRTFTTTIVDTLMYLTCKKKKNSIQSELVDNQVRSLITDMLVTVIKDVGSGMTVSMLAQVALFATGALSPIPAVRTFTTYACVSVFINYMLQMSVLMGLLLWDFRREYYGGFNLFSFIRLSPAKLVFMPPAGNPKRYFRSLSKRVINTFYVPALFRFSSVRALLLWLAVLLWSVSFMRLPDLKVGLDQTTALPTKSQLQNYFKDIFEKTKLGPPVYFVIEPGYDYSDSRMQARICLGVFCDDDSMLNLIAGYVNLNKNTNNTTDKNTTDNNIEKFNSRLAATPVSWLDSYIRWLAPNSGFIADKSCCRYVEKVVLNDGSIFTPSKPYFCDVYNDNIENWEELFNLSGIASVTCRNCLKSQLVGGKKTRDALLRPNSTEFIAYLPWFLNAVPDIKFCPLGGKALFNSAVKLNQDFYENHFDYSDLSKNYTFKSNPKNTLPNETELLFDDFVVTSNFMGYHTQLVTSDEFVDAMKANKFLEEFLSNKLNHTVFMISVFNVYYDGYLNIWNSVYFSFGIVALVLVLVSLLMFGFELRLTLILTVVVFNSTVCTGYFMYLFDIELNPVTLVNSIMLVAINYEFCVHMCAAYQSLTRIKSRARRARAALEKTGGSTFSGIFMTKVFGLAVLGFARSKIFRIYYFKMYILAITSATIHGMVILPVMLSFFGSVTNKSEAKGVAGEEEDENENIGTLVLKEARTLHKYESVVDREAEKNEAVVHLQEVISNNGKEQENEHEHEQEHEQVNTEIVREEANDETTQDTEEKVEPECEGEELDATPRVTAYEPLVDKELLNNQH